MSSSNNNGNSTNDLADQEKLLPWLVNDTLEPAEKDALQQILTHSEKLQQDKKDLEHLRQQIKAQSRPNLPVEFAWQKLKRQIDREKKKSNKKSVNKTSSIATTKWRITAIAASALLAIQTTSIITSLEEDTFIPLSSGLQTTTTYAQIFTVEFVGAVTMDDIHQLLLKHQLSIISGPSSAGLYRLVSQEKSDTILQTLKNNSKIIKHVQVEE